MGLAAVNVYMADRERLKLAATGCGVTGTASRQTENADKPFADFHMIVG